MNRKLLVNELLGWSDINEASNEQIIKLIETYVKAFPELRRKKTPPKIKRLQNKETKVIEKTIGLIIKKHLRFGINSITKELEKDASNFKFILVCKSCKPILTRHIQIMCARSNVPAGCVKDLSNKLAKIFNLKSISAFAILNKSNEDATQELLNQANCVNSDLANKIIQLLPSVKNPFATKSTADIVVDVEMPSQSTETQTIIESFKQEEKMETTFGADFISFKEPETKISFNSNKFILFNDEYSDSESDENTSEVEDQSTRAPKRKLTTKIQNSNDLEFNKFSIKIRPTNKKREKKFNKSSLEIKK